MLRIFAFLILTFSLFGDDRYQSLLEQYPNTFGPKGSWKEQEIEVVTSPAEIQRIEKQNQRRLIRKGFSAKEAKENSRIGVICEDQYWIWLRDAVIFPGGVPGTYDRILWKNALGGPSGVAILPVLPDKKIVVNINFRHATRSWEMEIPRGARNASETIEQAALRELREESGYIASKFIFLGEMAPDSGMITSQVPVYFGLVREKKASQQDDSEAIIENIALTLEEIKRNYIRGYIILDIQGEKTKVYCRDPFLSFALMQATWRNLL